MTVETEVVTRCRLCGAVTEQRFVLKVLGQYEVPYMECSNCESLQTADPFWLSETYSGLLPNLDVGGARRALRSCAVVLLASLITRTKRRSTLMDFGGGDGFVCRSLRDLGFDAFIYDMYAPNNYAWGYEADPSQHFDIITCFEVWEHLPKPREEFERLFAKGPLLLIGSSDIYRQQGSTWPYLGPEQGGHVFFYSKKAMQQVAATYGFDVVTRDSTTVFCKEPLRGWQRSALYHALGPIGLLLGRLWMQTIRPRR